MDKSIRHDELVKKLEEALEIADQINDDVAVALVERALRHARTISGVEQVKA